MLYLDVAATTKPSAAAIKEFTNVSENNWMNPSSKTYSAAASNLLNDCRKRIAKVVGAEPGQIIFTSGSTEAANWVISQDWDVIITSEIEHPCVYRAIQAWPPAVLYIPVDSHGIVDIDFLRRMLETFKFHDRILVAIMGANNETGTIQPVREISTLVAEYPNAKYFADNTQLWAHTAPRLNGVDFSCASAHKFGGFKGTGFLYAKDPSALSPLLYGGHQEMDLRAGTENVAGIAAMTVAFEETQRIGNAGAEDIRNFINSLAAESGCVINGAANGLPNIVSLTMPDCKALEMIVALSMDEIYVSAGSACSLGLPDPSRVLTSMGLTEEEALRTIRISFDNKVRREDIEYLFERINYYREVLHDKD